MPRVPSLPSKCPAQTTAVNSCARREFRCQKLDHFHGFPGRKRPDKDLSLAKWVGIQTDVDVQSVA